MDRKDLERATASGRTGWRQNWRPEDAQTPGPGEESVWDYPRPPIIDDCPGPVRIALDGHIIADTSRAKRIKETASPPTIYINPDDVDFTVLKEGQGVSVCEWKGKAAYYDVVLPSGKRVRQAGWGYPEPFEAIIDGMAELRDWVCFYPAKVECYVAGERVRPQPGQFYGGWITDQIKGPFKGEPGTGGW